MNKEDKIREIIEQSDPQGELDTDKMESIIHSVLQEEKSSELNKMISINDSTVDSLKEMMNNSDDWRVRASIAEKIISLGL